MSTATAPKRVHIGDLRNDQREWLNALAFYKEDIVILEHRLEDIVRRNNKQEVMAELEQVIAKLDIRYIYDLRSIDERRSEPTAWPQTGATMAAHDYEMDISAFMAAFAEGPNAEKARAAMTAFYPAVVDSHKVQFREIFAELLRGDEGAVLYHCSAGKDRTGVQTA